jgi:hypothetical protein
MRHTPTKGRGDSAAQTLGNTLEHREALHLIQHAADAFVTWEGCAGHSKAEACWSAFEHATKCLESIGGTMPNRETLRLLGRFNGEGKI